MIYKGEHLKEYVIERLEEARVKNPRFCQEELTRFIYTKDYRICGIYGLRRTGKSVMLWKAIEGLNYNNVMLINCANTDSYLDIESAIRNSSEKYIFIDEITKAQDFIKLCSSLSDSFVGKKIVITGTDSASLLLAKGDELFDRITLIHTTYISYKEYSYLIEGSIFKYIRYGGTLVPGKSVYNEDDFDEYKNSAIVKNICNSVKNGGAEVGFSRLYNLYLSDSLEAAINKAIEYRAELFNKKILSSEFEKSHQFGVAKKLVLKERNSFEREDVELISRWTGKEIRDYIASKMNFSSSTDIKEEDVELITRFLQKLDVLQTIPGQEVVFTQPGMQYALTKQLLAAVIQSEEYQKLYPDTQKLMVEKIMQDIEDCIIKNIFKSDLVHCEALRDMVIGKESSYEGCELDAYIVNQRTGRAIVYDIKRSAKIAENQTIHLTNKDFCDKFEKTHCCKIVERAVVYTGNTTAEDLNGIKINYYNVEEFLCNIADMTSALHVAPLK